MNKLEKLKEDINTQITVFETMRLMRGELGLSQMENDTLGLLYRTMVVLDKTRVIRKEETHED